MTLHPVTPKIEYINKWDKEPQKVEWVPKHRSRHTKSMKMILIKHTERTDPRILPTVYHLRDIYTHFIINLVLVTKGNTKQNL